MRTRICGMAGLLFSLMFAAGVARAQCPGEADVEIEVSGRQSFEEGKGVLTFSFSQPLFSEANRKQYRVRLYEKVSERYIYDDNNPPSLNTVKISIFQNREVKFEDLPHGDYTLELHGKECQYQRFNVPAQSPAKQN